MSRLAKSSAGKTTGGKLTPSVSAALCTYSKGVSESAAQNNSKLLTRPDRQLSWAKYHWPSGGPVAQQSRLDAPSPACTVSKSAEKCPQPLLSLPKDLRERAKELCRQATEYLRWEGKSYRSTTSLYSDFSGPQECLGAVTPACGSCVRWCTFYCL